MRAGFDDATLVEHEDKIGIADGGKTMCNDDARATLHQANHGLLDVHFCSRIDIGRGFIEDEDGGIGQGGSCNG